MQSIDFKKFLPHIIILFTFLIISFLYSYPVLQGKVLSQGDITGWHASSHEAEEWFKKTGENTLWTNSMFGGMPTYTFYVPKNTDYFILVMQSITDTMAKPANFLFLAMICFYILMSTLKVDKWLGALGAVAFAFSTYNLELISSGHDSKMVTIAYMPLVLSALLILYRGKYLYGGIFLSVAFALIVIASHLQVIYYLAIVMALAVLSFFIDAIKQGQLKQFFMASVIALFAMGLGLCPGISNVLTVREYSEATMRGGKSELTIVHDKNKTSGGLDKEYAFQWSNGVGETFCILIPYLYGGSGHEPISSAPKAGEILSNAGYNAVPLYWGPQPFLAGPVYFGAIICFLFVLGMFLIRSNNKWWIFAASIIGIILSCGKNIPSINYFLFDHLPMYNKFRVPSMALVIPEFLFPLVGIWGVSEIINGAESKEALWKKVKIAVAITAGLCVVIAFGGKMFFSFSNPSESNYPAELVKALRDDRADLAMSSGLKSALFIVLTAGLLWAFIKDKIKSKLLIGGLAILIAADLIPIAFRYLGEDSYKDNTENEAAFEPRPVDKQILQDKDPYYRVLDLSRDTYNDAIQCYFHKSVGGYSPAKLEIYQDLIDIYMNRQTGFNGQVLNMLNTKYVIVPTDNKGSNQMVQRNPNALGNAWFVNEIKWAKNADEEMMSMKAANIGDTALVPNAWEPKKTAVVHEKFKNDLNGYTFGKDSMASIKLTKYGLNDLTFQSNNSQNGFGVFSDIYYEKGWEAYVDGKQTPIVKADYVLRGIKIPAGIHKIEFFFRPKTHALGEKIALISSMLLYALGIMAIVMLLKKKKEPQAP
ncbi:MAG: YfhO family protein [Bacteroidota bacterium]